MRHSLDEFLALPQDQQMEYWSHLDYIATECHTRHGVLFPLKQTQIRALGVEEFHRTHPVTVRHEISKKGYRYANE